jgi:P-type E1-E2 ATPase
MFNNLKALQYNKFHNIFEEVSWKDLAVGRIVKIQKNEIIPADVLILKSSSSNGFCYLQTSSLDGETGLKPREAIYRMQSFIYHEKALSDLRGEINVDSPNENIYSINGSLNFQENLNYFSVTNTLLRVIIKY